MINIINTASDDMITPSSVDQVGVCYYDYETESILELSSIAINMCSVSPITPVIKKYFLIADDPFMYVDVSLVVSATTSAYFGAKLIVNEVQPSISDFDALIEFNTAKVVNPLQNHLIPIWILMYPKASASIDINMSIRIEAEEGAP